MSSDLIDIKKIDINNPAEVSGAVEFIIAYDLFVEAYLLIKRLDGKGSSPLSQRGGRGDFSEAGSGNIDLTAVARDGGAGSASESMAKLTGVGMSKNPPFPVAHERRDTESPFGKGGELGNDILVKLKWIALPKLKNEEIIKMFEENFTTIFEIEGYDLWSKLKQKIIYDIWYEDRDGFKENIKKALLKNEEWLTENKIIINDKECAPTVGNWLKDYNVRFGLGRVDATAQSEYLANSKNMKTLKKGERGKEDDKFPAKSAGRQISKFQNGEGIEVEEGGGIDEKEKLKILFNFYEKLKISSLTAEGFEEGLYINEDGVEGVLDDGEFTKIDPREKEKIRELQRIIDNVAVATRGNNADLPAQAGINAEITRKESSPLSQRGGRGDFSEAGVGNIGLTAATRDSGKKESASESIVDKNELNRRKIPPSAFGSRPPLEKGVGEQAKRAYVFSLAEQVLIKQNEEDIKRVARGNIILVGKELTKASEQKNRPRVIAALRLAVKNNLLLGWSRKNVEDGEEGKLRNKEIKKLGDKDAVIKFLKKVLEERLGLSENEAAKIGVHLYNLFRKLGRDIGYLAYYDEKEQKFYWMGE